MSGDSMSKEPKTRPDMRDEYDFAAMKGGIQGNGTHIVFSSNRSGTFDLWTMPSTGGLPTQLTSDAVHEDYPAWSPNGAFIAYGVVGAAGHYDIWLLPAAGGQTIQLTTHPSVDRYPAWSPDGTRIAFSSSRVPPLAIWVMDLSAVAVAPTTRGSIKGQFR